MNSRLVSALMLLVSAPCRADTVVLPPGSDIQQWIDILGDGDVIQLQDGLYDPDGTLTPTGKSITIRGETDAFGNPTSVISGGGLFRVVECVDGEGPGTVFENLVIRDGRAQFTGGLDSGGGIYCVESSPTIRNCTFLQNVADQEGGGLYVRSGEPQVIGCRFVGNAAGKGGGACVFSIGVNPPWNPVFDGCRFTSNEAKDIDERNFPFGEGGALYIENTDTLIDGCIFQDNHSGVRSGALHSEDQQLELIDCGFEDNSSAIGGAMYARGSSLDFEGCLFKMNRAGAIHAEGCSIFAARSRFLSNLGAVHGGAVHHEATTAVYIESDFEENVALDDGGALYRKDNSSNLVIASCTLIGNVAGGVGGGVWGGVLQLADSVICANVPDQIAGGSIVEDLGGNLISEVGPCIPLPGDFDGNFVIDGADLAVVLGQWGPCRRGGCIADLDGNRIVNGGDLAMLLANWGSHVP